MAKPSQPIINKALNLGKREKIQQANSTMLIIVAVAAVIVSMALVSVDFLWKEKGHNDRVYTAEKTASNTLKSNVTNARNLAAQYQLINSSSSVANAQTILDALPPTYDDPDLLASVQTLVETAGLTLTSLTSTDSGATSPTTQPQPTPQQMSYALVVQGTYAQVNLLVLEIEDTIRPMDVTSLIMSGSGSQMTANLTVNTYYQPVKSLTIATSGIK